jgi:hypothetical protein
MSERPEARRATVPPALSRQEQLDAVSDRTRGQTRTRIETAIAEIRAPGEAIGLQIGDVVPDFAPPDALGRSTALTAALVTGPVVLTSTEMSGAPSRCRLHGGRG